MSLLTGEIFYTRETASPTRKIWIEWLQCCNRGVIHPLLSFMRPISMSPRDRDPITQLQWGISSKQGKSHSLQLHTV
jgi:hypothetical protein